MQRAQAFSVEGRIQQVQGCCFEAKPSPGFSCRGHRTSLLGPVLFSL